ncbi:MAG: molybdopterin molybdotransferase MoeA [Erythrobacter sp.]|nr:MAG: molybdopterin molybdotransferase MoeA [Erythrobacter sp.]
MNPKPLIPLEEAQARLLALAKPLGSAIVPVEEAVGHYLAEPLLARRTQPAADLSAMDGYAVGEADLSGPWRVIGESAAGHPFAGTLAPREAVRISTGAMMPSGGGAVLLQEDAILDGGTLRLSGSDSATPRHIRRKGFDFAEGDLLLEAGSRIGPAQLALAIGSGHGELPVGRRASLCVIDSGDELASDPAQALGHQIPASNGPMLATMAAPFVGECRRIGPVADRLEALVAAFEQTGDADVIVTSGGASVGDHDLVRPALEAWGATIDFWRIALRPGKPLLVARKGTTLVLGLPGNPVSSYVTAFLFLLPLLRNLAGAGNPLPKSILLPLGGVLPETGPRTEFYRASLEPGGVLPYDQRDSSALRSLAAANALIARRAGAAAASVGDTVEVFPLQNGGIA